MKRLSLIAVLLFGVCVTGWAQGGGSFVPTVTESDHLTLTGTGTTTGIDINGNGLIDFLMLTVGVNNTGTVGWYTYSVKLTDKNGTVLGEQDNVSVFVSMTSFTLFFDGSVIGHNGVDGPYYLTDLSLQSQGGVGSLIAPVAFETDPLKADQFEDFTGVADTTPPTITVAATPSVLWPPDHKMHEIQVDVTATDNVDANPVVALFGIVSNQGVNLVGDGNTSPDIMVQDGHIYLRAERNATMSTDRVYAITYTATDAAGNVATGFATVTVPHDHRSQ